MAGISPAAEAGRTSDRPLSCGRGSSLPDRHTLPAQRADALVAAPRQASGLAAGPQVVAVAAKQRPVSPSATWLLSRPSCLHGPRGWG
jgi:hypothetical protein